MRPLYQFLSREARPKVFGLGLSKTGTSSLGAALEILGFHHAMYDRRLTKDYFAGRFDRIDRVLWRNTAFEDWPYPAMFERLMQRYGTDAYYVLTVRKSPETWLASLERHALLSSPKNAKIRALCYGLDYPQQDASHFLERYNAHNRNVADLAERLGLSSRFRVLCFENGDGWSELCGLLGLPLPDVPFPIRNRTADRVPNQRHVAANMSRIAALATEPQ
ncbi:MAG: hypothetical protein J0I99_11930 [Devosia sp.]|uniref:sulfotransferase n=1 Tax=Devosia sp. TaxID=1871048 RepID=UPI001ACE414A|nr:sulfotransferase [Devosia sp.]MBN9316443.1 hypothetical protein [Devosia sp.]